MSKYIKQRVATLSLASVASFLKQATSMTLRTRGKYIAAATAFATGAESAVDDQFRTKLLVPEDQRWKGGVEERVLAGLKAQEVADHINQK